MTHKIPKEFTQYHDWVLDLDRTGAIMFVNPKTDVSVYCTPEWEGMTGIIPIEVYGHDVEEIAEVPFSGDFSPAFWFESVKPFLDKYSPVARTAGKK